VTVVIDCDSPEPVVVAWPPPPPPKVTTLLIPPPPCASVEVVLVVCAGKPDVDVMAPAEPECPVVVAVAPDITPVYVLLYCDSAARMLDGMGAIVAPMLEQPSLF